MHVADLIVLTNVPKRYSYEVPSDCDLVIGDYVDIIFAKRKQVGLVVSLSNRDSSEFSYPLSLIQSIHDKRARVPIELIQLVEWFSKYYCVSEYHALQCIVGMKKVREFSAKNNAPTDSLAKLSDRQMDVYQQILDSDQMEHLIHGVTGSGKTLIYAHLIQHQLTIGCSAILLIPEISLTPQFTNFFATVFDGVAVVHSGLTPKKKEEIWAGALSGDIKVIIGPRSAIFMPLQSLSLIIIDEEHDNSYKQESSPRYFTHEVARQRAKIHQARLILGSATPALTTFARNKENGYGYYRLTERYNAISMPKVSILDLSAAIHNHLIHDHLVTKIEDTLKQKQKVLILVNRRGYSSFLKCHSCGDILQCPDCETSYTYHSDGFFRCHRCSAIKKMTRQCPSCGEYDLEYSGIAIQKVEYELKRLFPSAGITRIDRDLVKNYDQLQDSLDAFNQGADILIGTQMISKGHNFPNLGLVGMIGMDTMLNFPDYRATERLFQLMTQTAGRAGRDMNGSQVMIQTFNPNHYVFDFVKDHDVDSFLNQEMTFRRALSYPPFRHIVNIIFSAKKQSLVESLYPKIQQFNQTLNDLNVQAIGPKVAPIDKVSGFYRHNVFYKVDETDLDVFKSRLAAFPKKRDVRCVVDIDPMSLL